VTADALQRQRAQHHVLIILLHIPATLNWYDFTKPKQLLWFVVLFQCLTKATSSVEAT
jgi:hypothetical protein